MTKSDSNNAKLTTSDVYDIVEHGTLTGQVRQKRGYPKVFFVTVALFSYRGDGLMAALYVDEKVNKLSLSDRPVGVVRSMDELVAFTKYHGVELFIPQANKLPDFNSSVEKASSSEVADGKRSSSEGVF